MLDFALRFDPARAPGIVARYREVFAGGRDDEAALGVASVLGAAYPALAGALAAAPEIARSIARDGHATPRDRSALTRRVLSRVGALDDAARVRRELRKVATEEKVRVALRELLPPSAGGADVDVTAAELSALADVVIQTAFDEALFATSRRFGVPRAASGNRVRFTVLGMGKLGGDELNAGSDVDLLYFYDTDEGAARADDGTEIALHDFWTRVAKRMTATLDDVTEDGLVFRVDLRLRPEGRSGPIVNSLAAAERYYEAFGRLWERAALLRARPVAGDLAFGREVLSSLEPFIWRRSVDPRIALEMVGLARRSRAELSVDPARDVKLAPGGIREAEFFVQTLQLVWGGREARLRVRGTLDGLRRLRAQGLVSDREFREVAAAYLALRRAEHVVQTSSGIQTHLLPEPGVDRDRVARALGFKDGPALVKDLGGHTRRVAARFASLVPKADRAEAGAIGRWTEAIAAAERSNLEAFVDAVVRAAEATPTSPFSEDEEAAARASHLDASSDRWREVAADLFELSRHPDAPLGARTRERFPELAETVLDAAIDAADPQQAARYLRRIFARVRHPGIYARLLSDDKRAVRRLVEALGASAFVGEAVANHPELGDFVLFARGAPTADVARAEVADAWSEALAAPGDDEPDEALAGALRRAKARVTIEVALADLGGELDTRGATLSLSGLADATLDAAAHAVLHDGAPSLDRPVRGLAVLAMGKLGGREIGYGSDLDVLFLFDPEQAPPDVEPEKYFALAARRMMRLISVSHPAGPGYELDTRLRPSGSQGLLVTSVDAFARYHGAADDGARVRVKAAAWERLALLRARAAAGDPELGARAMQVAHAAAYELPFDAAAVREEIHRLRTRLERENSQERRGTGTHDRYDVKLGKGGLLDVEFAVQLLQLEHGRDPRVRTPETAVALEALAAAGYLAPKHADALREGYGFLRKLEQRIRIVHDSAINLIEDGAPGLVPLARRMGIRTLRGKAAAAELLARYREVTDRVRLTYEAIVAARATP